MFCIASDPHCSCLMLSYAQAKALKVGSLSSMVLKVVIIGLYHDDSENQSGLSLLQALKGYMLSNVKYRYEGTC